MQDLITLLTIFAITLLIIILTISIIRTKYKDLIHYCFLFLMVFLLIWNLGILMEIIYNMAFHYYSYEIVKVGFFGLTFFPVILLITAYVFVRQKASFVRFIPLFIIPVITNIIIFTNNYHHWFHKVYSPDSSKVVYGFYFYVHTFYSYTCLLISFILFIYASIKKSGIISKQAILILIGGLIPFFANITVSLQIIHATRYITHLYLGITAFCFWFAIFKYDFLNLVPLARKIIMDGISDSFLVLDSKANVIDFNEPLNKKFALNNNFKFSKGMSFDFILKNSAFSELGHEKAEKVKDSILTNHINFSFEQHFPTLNSYFFIEVSPVTKNNHFAGSIIFLKDITRYKKLLNEIESLTRKNERDRMREQLHDKMGHGLYGVLRLIELCKMKTDDESDEIIDILNKAETYTKKTISDLRSLVEASQYSLNIIQSLELLFKNYSNSALSIDFVYKGDFKHIDMESTNTIYKICMEALTNAVRHGRANKVAVILRVNENALNLFIMDNGKGCEKVNLGFGTSKMKERVESLKGNISFSSESGEGFQISADLPLNPTLSNAVN